MQDQIAYLCKRIRDALVAKEAGEYFEFSEHQIELRSTDHNEKKGFWVLMVIFILGPFVYVVQRWQKDALEWQLALIFGAVIFFGIRSLNSGFLSATQKISLDLEPRTMSVENTFPRLLAKQRKRTISLDQINSAQTRLIRDGNNWWHHRWHLEILDQGGNVFAYMILSDELEEEQVRGWILALVNETLG